MSSIQQREVQELRHELRDCELYSGMGLIYEDSIAWELAVQQRLSSLNYKIINDFPGRIKGVTFFGTIAQSIAPHKRYAIPAVTESPDSPPFVIAVFVSGWIESPYQLLQLNTGLEEINIVDDIIQPFLPQSAPHLQHVPKLFFITAQCLVDSHAPLPRFPEGPDGNYCIVYHVANTRALMIKWVDDITDDLFIRGMTVQGAIEKSRSHLKKDEENLYYFTYLKRI